MEAISIFNDFSEIKKYISANANNELATLEPYINDAARDYLIPVLGQQEWNLMLENMPDSLTAEQQSLLPFIHNVLANFGYYLFADDGSINLSDSGLYRLEDEQSKSPYQWQVRKFQDRRWLNGWNALEALAQFLYQNIDDYDLWAASIERDNYNELLVWNTYQFKQFYRIQSLGVLWSLHPQIKEVQNDLKNMITATLFNSVMDNIMAANITEANANLLPYLQRVVVFGTLMQVAKNFGYEFGKSGLQIATIEGTSQNSDKTDNAVNQARQNLYDEFETKYDKALNKLLNFLNTNSTASVYPSYYTAYLNVTAPTVVDNNDEKGLKFFG